MDKNTVEYEVEIVNNVLKYLQSRPYGEVANLINSLANPIQEAKVEETEPDQEQ